LKCFHNISTVKREIRILGIDTCNSKYIIGAIVRGGSFLDGIVQFDYEKSPSLAEQITIIPFFPELRAIMIHDPLKKIDSKTIELKTGLPVLVVSRKNRKGLKIQRSRKTNSLRIDTRLSPTITEKIVRLSWTYGVFPEPLRIAHLLSRHSSIGKTV
jgi:endonuclease V-like protein UPF0215 family